MNGLPPPTVMTQGNTMFANGVNSAANEDVTSYEGQDSNEELYQFAIMPFEEAYRQQYTIMANLEAHQGHVVYLWVTGSSLSLTPYEADLYALIVTISCLSSRSSYHGILFPTVTRSPCLL